MSLPPGVWGGAYPTQLSYRCFQQGDSQSCTGGLGKMEYVPFGVNLLKNMLQFELN